MLCSSATRARATLERIGPARHGAHVEPELYGAGAGALLARPHTLDRGTAELIDFVRPRDLEQ